MPVANTRAGSAIRSSWNGTSPSSSIVMRTASGSTERRMSRIVAIREAAAREGYDLAESWAYSDSFSDYAMLAVVGHPTACNPDLRLRSLARSYDWPVLDLDEAPDRSVARRPQGLAPVRRIRARPGQPD